MASKPKKGLGTGLDALFRETLIDEPEVIRTVSVSKVEPRADQPREYFDEEALQALADSIEQYGMIQPITVRKAENGFYQIIAGERRWRAARIAGLSEVPVNVIDVDDRKAAEIALVENLQRENLNPIEEAKGFQSLIHDFGLTQEEAARSVGKSRPALTNSLRLLNLPEEVMRMVEDNILSSGHARVLLSLTDPVLQIKTAQEIAEKGLSVRRTEKLIAELIKAQKKAAEAKPAEAKPAVDYAADVSDSLTKILGRRVTLNEGRKTGKIILEYYDADDREYLIDCLRTLKQKQKQE